MISVEEALRLVLEHATPGPPEQVPLAEAPGRTLAEDVKADRDSPPWDKALMDGYAVVAADVTDGRAELEIVEEVMAGQVPQRSVAPGTAIRIMTGAPLPEGADAVAVVESTEVVDDGSPLGRVRIEGKPLAPHQNVLTRGLTMQQGGLVVPRGVRIRTAAMGVLAEVGCDTVPVIRRPTLAALATGDELVPHDATPGPGQIRNSNEPMLVALAASAGAEPHGLGIAPDRREELREQVRQGLQHDILLLTGGVSAGVLDLVPGVLEELGVERVFHKVRLKPGKPLWFGVRRDAKRRCLVFGLPGNPVSSFVCFELFVRPAVAGLSGLGTARPHRRARLIGEFRHRGDRPTYHPAHLAHADDATAWVQPVRWQGSADVAALAPANALACFPAGDQLYEEGDLLDVVPLE